MAWYSTGTVSVTNGSDAVTADGTQFITNTKPGDIFVIQKDGTIYEIAEVVSATQLKLRRAYAGASGTSLQYGIVPTASYLKSLANQVSDLIALYTNVPADVAASAKSAADSAASAASAAGAAAASRVAKTGDLMSGPLIVEAPKSDTTGHVDIRGASGSLGNEGKLRLGGTFSGTNADTGNRLVASLRAGFNGGSWGTEYLDFYLNNTVNDGRSDSKMARVMRMSYGGRVLLGTTTDDGANALQTYSPSGDGTGLLLVAGGNAYGRGGAVSFAANLGSAAMSQIKGVLDNLYTGGAYDQGGLAFLTRPYGTSAAGALTERMRIMNTGRVLIGTTVDDGGTKVQVAGQVKGSNSSGALIASNGGGSGQTSVFLVREGAPTDQKRWELLHDGVGSVSLRTANDGYSAAQDALQITRGSGVNVGTMRLMPSNGRVVVGTTSDDGTNLLQVAGTGMFGNNISAYSSANDTQFTISASNYAGGVSLEAFNKANTVKKNIALAAWGGRVLVGVGVADDGATTLQVSGSTITSGPLRSGLYTLTTLPSAAAFQNFLITVTNATGGAKVCYSNGTNWCLLNTSTVVS
ncbi:hypothetical protein CFB82_20050 [Burkholderia sp. HI2714]|uniref:hypothetical protein n=1 Tax=Burkholderia sp. HI2714 TaxID=2015359 RepID=UPI000B7A460E|nr:hypothetical protein [Burkholderia sp. HI2714]OXJ32679.1 hypothetical protein CFB82_20050 [Burkholderia sp. HI2714]